MARINTIREICTAIAENARSPRSFQAVEQEDRKGREENPCWSSRSSRTSCSHSGVWLRLCRARLSAVKDVLLVAWGCGLTPCALRDKNILTGSVIVAN